MFSSEEQKFIDDIDARFPDRLIREKFNLYASLDPTLRLQQAVDDVKKLQRAGWVRINAPEETRQSVFEHDQSAGHYIRLFAKRHAIKDIEHAILIVLNHDKPCEAIVGDFTPVDTITKPEKAKIEDLSARTVLAAHLDTYSRWCEYEAGQTLSAQIAHDADQMEMLTRALYIEERHPKLHDALTPFWDYAVKRLHTPMAKQDYAELANMRDNAVPSQVYEDMRTHYLSQNYK